MGAKRKTKSSTKDMCCMNGCDREAFYKRSKLCQRCYSWLYYNKGKSVTELMERKQQLEFWESRLDGYLGSRPKKPALKRVK